MLLCQIPEEGVIAGKMSHPATVHKLSVNSILFITFPAFFKLKYKFPRLVSASNVKSNEVSAGTKSETQGMLNRISN